MKKLIILALCMLFGSVSLVCAQSGPDEIPVQYPPEPHGNDPKSPVLLPTVYYEDYVLTFDSSCIGCTIELVQNDVVVFTGVVDPNGEVEIPDTLVGLVELRIYRDGIMFVGEFEP